MKSVIVGCPIKVVQILVVMQHTFHLMIYHGMPLQFHVELIEVLFVLILSGLFISHYFLYFPKKMKNFGKRPGSIIHRHSTQTTVQFEGLLE